MGFPLLSFHKIRDPKASSKVAWINEAEQVSEWFSNNYDRLLGIGDGRTRIRIKRFADSNVTFACTEGDTFTGQQWDQFS